MSQPLLQQSRSPAPLAMRLLRRAGIDRAIGFTALEKIWTAASGLVTLVLMTRFLSPVQQGYYFTFGSVLALAVFFELGLCLVLVQFASHERAGLEWTPTGLLDGDPIAKARLSSLLRISVKWYGAITALLLLTVLPAGLLFFGRHGNPGVVWQIPWIWIALASGLTIALTPVLSILEGCGLIAEIARVRMWQSVAGSILLWIALVAHWGLFAAPITNTVSLVLFIAWLWRKKQVFLRDLLRPSDCAARIDWRGEVWPLQWQVALSCVSGYFVFQLFNPILFATHGAVAAGQLGLSMTLMSAVAAISIAWVTTKAATFGTIIANQDYRRLDRLFFPCLWQSWVLASAGAGSVCLLGYLLHSGHFALSSRILAPLPMALLAGATILNHGLFSEAIYLRAHKREPFLFLALIAAGLVALSSLLLAKPFGATGMMLGYLTVCALNLGQGTWIFAQKRRQWHETSV